MADIKSAAERSRNMSRMDLPAPPQPETQMPRRLRGRLRAQSAECCTGCERLLIAGSGLCKAGHSKRTAKPIYALPPLGLISTGSLLVKNYRSTAVRSALTFATSRLVG